MKNLVQLELDRCGAGLEIKINIFDRLYQIAIVLKAKS